jgi:hypothetical protein
MARFWQESLPASNAIAVFNLKTELKAHGWTVPSSSDGTTYNASGDQITTGASGAGGLDNASAWFRLRSANGLVEFTVQRGTGGAPNNYRIKIGKTAFTAGSPSATQTPTVADPTYDEKVALGGGTDAAPSFGALIGAVGTTRIKTMVDDATGEFYMAGFPDGGGNPNCAFMLTGFDGYDPDDTWPYMVYVVSTGAWTGSAMSSTTGNCFSWMPEDGGLPVTVLPQLATIAGNTLYPGGAAVDPITGNHPIPKVSVGRGAGDNAGICYKGFANLFRWVGIAGDATGDTYTLSTTRDWIVMRSCALPWDGSSPTNGVATTDRTGSDLVNLPEEYSLVVVGGAGVVYVMIASDSVTDAPYTWVSNGRADYDGDGYPGPNAPTNVAIAFTL